MKTSESSRIRVWVSITLMVAVYIGAVYWVYRASSTASEPAARLLPLATSMAVVPCVLVIILSISSMIAKAFRYRARVLDSRISPEIRETLAERDIELRLAALPVLRYATVSEQRPLKKSWHYSIYPMNALTLQPRKPRRIWVFQHPYRCC